MAQNVQKLHFCPIIFDPSIPFFLKLSDNVKEIVLTTSVVLLIPEKTDSRPLGSVRAENGRGNVRLCRFSEKKLKKNYLLEIFFNIYRWITGHSKNLSPLSSWYVWQMFDLVIFWKKQEKNFLLKINFYLLQILFLTFVIISVHSGGGPCMRGFFVLCFFLLLKSVT